MVSRHPGGRPRELKRCELGQRIENIAARRGLHLDQIAEEAGVRLPTIYRIITGRTPDPKTSTIQAIARALGVPLTRLVG